MKKVELKKNWTLDSNSFQKLLVWFDAGEDSDGRNYLEIRRRLVAFFDRKNCLRPEELADETLNRVARRLAEEGAIDAETPAKYCYITARFVFLESLRGGDAANVPLDDVLPKVQSVSSENDNREAETKEKMLVCLDQCTGKLDAANRDLIVWYYFGEERAKIENRRSLAEKLGVSLNALSIRACRIRDKLETCVRSCVGDE